MEKKEKNILILEGALKDALPLIEVKDLNELMEAMATASVKILLLAGSCLDFSEEQMKKLIKEYGKGIMEAEIAKKANSNNL
jgi:uncharacterized protein YgbK (DUF1537 family)